jgi:exosortase/archaeosortase family protein
LRELDLWTASVTAELIRALGEDVSQRSTILVHPSGFGYEIYYPCTAFIPSALLTGALLFLRSTGTARALAVSTGVALVVGVNFLRLASLFFIGAHRPDLFPVAHDAIGQTVLVLFIGGYWFLCRKLLPLRVYTESR